MELRLNHEWAPCISSSSFATRRAFALEGLHPARSPRYSFLTNTFHLQSASHGSKRKVEVASARRKLPGNDSTLPRLLTTVYTPLLRCATASDPCNLACGLRTKQTGSC